MIKKLIGESPDELDATMYSLVPYLYGDDLKSVAVSTLTAEDVIF